MMSSAVEKPARICRKFRFGAFEVDLQNRELRKRGLRMKLQRKPFQILAILLETPGQLVPRAELAQRLWPNLHVNFDRSLNTAVNALRRVLDDPPRHSRYIETRPGLGYCFIAHVEEMPESASERAVAVPPVAPAAPGARHPEAYRDYLQGRYFFNKLTEDDLHKSVAYFESALAQDPGCALAQAGLADTYSMFALLNMLPAGEAYSRAKERALTAVQINPGLGEAHASLACVKRLFEWDWAGAQVEHVRAVELSPDSASTRRQYGAWLAAKGQHEEALRELQRARELDPLSLAIHVEIAWARYAARDYTQAAEQSWKALVMEPKFSAAQLTLGLAYEQMGMLDEAVVEFRNARVCSGDQPAVVAALAHFYAVAGRPSEAAEALQTLRELNQRRYVSSYWYGVVYAGLADYETALDWLENACEERDVWLTWLGVEPRFDEIRSQGRFQELLRKCKLL